MKKKFNIKKASFWFSLLLIWCGSFQAGKAQHRISETLSVQVPIQQIRTDCRFFQGDTLDGFSMQATIEEGIKKYDLYSELKWFVGIKEIDFVKRKYNIKNLPWEITSGQKIIKNPIVFNAACNNVDFENGNFGGWIGNVGYNANSNTPLTVTGAGINSLGTNSPETGCSFHTLTTAAGGADPWGGFPMIDPGGGTYAVRLGGENINTNNQAGQAGCQVNAPNNAPAFYSNGETLEQTFMVTANNTLLTYNYAVVLRRAPHTYGQQPYFRIEVLDAAQNTIPCLNYYVQGDSTGNYPPGFINVGGANGAEYLPWTTSSLNLLPYLGSNITVRFTAAGCIPGGHFGYAYVDCSCAPLEIIIPTFACQGGVDSLIAPPVAGSTYSWAGPGIVSGSTSQVITANVSGSYSVTITNAAGCSYVLDTSIVFSPNPTVTVNSPTLCAGTTTTLTANSTGSAGSLTYSWNPSAGLTFSAGDSSATLTPLANATYSVTGTSVKGCTSTAVANITVNKAPPPTFTAPPVCRGAQTVFTNTTPGNLTYHWNFGDATVTTDTSNLQNPTYTYPNSGTYVVSLTVTSVPGGCVATATQNVTVSPLPVIHFTANHPCDGASAIFTNTTPNQPGFSNWHWDFGDAGTATVASPTHTYPSADCYSVTLTATTALGCTGSFDTVVYVHKNPVAMLTAKDPCLGDSTKFKDGSSLANPPCLNDQIVAWNLAYGDGQTGVFSAATMPDSIGHLYASCGTHNVTITVTTNNNCTNTYTLTGDTVFCLPVVTAPANLKVCPNSAVPTQTFTATVTNGGPAYALWLASTIQTGMPALDSTLGGINNVPGYTSTPKNMSCTNLVDTVKAIAVSNKGCIGNKVYYTVSLYPTPYLKHMITDSVCAGQPLTVPAFTACPVNSTIAWTNNNTTIGLGASGNGNLPTFTGANPSNTTFNIGLIHAKPSANGCPGNDSTFSIVIKPQPKIAVVSPASYCPGDIVPSPSITTTPTTGVTYNWSVTNHINIGMPLSGTGLPLSYTAPANNSLANQSGVVTYSPTYNGCAGPASTETITIKPTPFVTPVPNTFYCPGQLTAAVNFSCTPAGGQPIFTWTIPGGQSGTQTGNIAPYTTSNPTPYTIVNTYTVNATLNNCKGPDSHFNISVYPNPVANFSFSHGVCEGKPVSFTDLSTASAGFAVSGWAWDMNADGISDVTVKNPQYTITPSGQHPITLTVSTNSAPSCTAVATHTLFINPNPVADFKGDSLVGCPALHTLFSDLSTVSSGNVTSWNWVFGNGQTSSSQTPPKQTYSNSSPILPLTYTVFLTVKTDSGCVNSITKNSYIEVYPRPIADFSWGPETANIDDPAVTFVNQATGAAEYYPYETFGHYGVQYYLGDVFANDPSTNYVFTNSNFSHSYNHSDPYIYYATQWVINSYGCKDSITKPVEIKPDFTFYIPNAFSPTGDGVNDGFKGYGVGIDNSTYNLWIFDRWGLMLYHAHDIDQPWNGHMHNDSGKTLLQQDVYVWVVKFNDFTGTKHEYHGTVTLLK